MMNDREYTLKVRDMEVTVTKKKLTKLLFGVAFVISSYVVLVSFATVLPAGLLMLQGIVTILVLVIMFLKLWEFVEFEQGEES